MKIGGYMWDDENEIYEFILRLEEACNYNVKYIATSLVCRREHAETVTYRLRKDLYCNESIVRARKEAKERRGM